MILFRKLLTGILILTVPYMLLAFPETAGSNNKRALIGIELFPSFLASDKNIHEKKRKDGSLTVVVAYLYNPKIANDMAYRLNSLGKIREIPIHVISVSVEEFEDTINQTIGGIYIAEPGAITQQIIKESINNHFIVFSPYEGDVEKGATGGIYITEKIVPYLNMTTLNAAKIRMKSFFLRVSKKYE